MTLTNCQLFKIIEQSKKERLYTIANAAFVILADRALDSDCFTFVWEANPQAESGDIYYDLLVITDGIRSACIPAPLLRKPLAFRAICSLEIEKKEHRREFISGTASRAFAFPLLKEKNLKGLLQKYLKSPVSFISGERRFNGKGDCLCCSFYDGEQGTCATFASYPINDEGFCQQWQLG